MQLNDILTTAEAARFLGIPRWHVLRYIQAGQLKSKKFGIEHAITNSDLLDLANRKANGLLPKQGRPVRKIKTEATVNK